MPVHYRPDCYRLHVAMVRRLVPGYRLSTLTCQQCGRQAQALYVHPNDPEYWRCTTCMQFRKGYQGQYQLGALARAQHALNRLAREHTRSAAAPEAAPAAAPQRTRKTESGG